MADILLDANMLIVPFQFTVDVVDELHRLFENPAVYTLDRCLAEAQQVEQGEYASLVTRFIDTQNITVLETERDDTPVDQLLVEYADKYIIATNDKEIRTGVEEQGGDTVYLRSSAHLATTAF